MSPIKDQSGIMMTRCRPQQDNENQFDLASIEAGEVGSDCRASEKQRQRDRATMMIKLMMVVRTHAGHR